MTLTREFDFPREALFDMVTDSKKAEKWFGSPEGAAVLDFKLDVRPGGEIKIHDRLPDGTEGSTTGSFVEIAAPERISFKTATSLNGSAVPFEAMQTMVFEEIGPRRTRLTVLVDILSAGTIQGGAQALAQGYKGGWGQSLDKLQRELRTR